MKDYYSLLGVEQSATKTEIKKNYRLLAATYHPDKNSDPEAVQKFIAITEAYEVLGNKKSRIKYDLYRWEKLKQQKESSDSFNIVVPHFQSTRIRRNKDQQKRGIKYHKIKSEPKKQWQLLIESFYIVGRYVLPILGITLLVLFLNAALNQLSPAFEKNIIRGIFISGLILAIVYIIYWISKNGLLEFKKDLKFFSIFYKITQKKATTISLLTAVFFLLLYFALLVIYF